MHSDESEYSDDHHFEPHDAIEKLFNYNPRSVTTEASWAVRNEKAPSPFWFYDKHLDHKLSLLRVKYMPSITKIISHTTDFYMKSIEARGIELPLIGHDSMFYSEARRNEATTTLTDASSVARFYLNTTAEYCVPVASTFVLHPQAPDWMTAFTWSQRGERGPPAWMSEGYSLRPLDSSGKFRPSLGLSEYLEPAITEKMQDLVDRLPHLGTWEIGAVSDKSEALLREMSEFFPSKSFHPEVCGTISPSYTAAVTHNKPPDARSGALSTVALASRGDTGLPTIPLRRSARLALSAKPVTQAPTESRPELSENLVQTKHGQVSTVRGKRLKSVIPAPESNYDDLTVERLLQHVIIIASFRHRAITYHAASLGLDSFCEARHYDYCFSLWQLRADWY